MQEVLGGSLGSASAAAGRLPSRLPPPIAGPESILMSSVMLAGARSALAASVLASVPM